MQFHYVVGYDTVLKRWFMELDTYAYFQDGHIWDDMQYDDTGYGWRGAEDDSDDAVIDQTLTNTLYSLVDIFPIPGEDEEDGWKRRTRSPIGSIYADLVKEQDNATS